jgi:hypothetical protein
LETEAERVSKEQISIENKTVAEITLRMDTELRAIDADNKRMTLEVRAQEAAAASLVAAEAAIAVAKSREDYEMRALNMTRMRTETEARAAKAAEEALLAESRATVLARQHIEEANQTATKAAKEALIAESRAKALAQQRIEAANQAKELAIAREQEEYLRLELEQQNLREESRASEIAAQKLELERRTAIEIEARLDMEFQAAEAARKLEVAEVLAKDAASEKRFVHEQTTQALFAREALDRQMTAVDRQEFERLSTELETGKLMSKLRKTRIISKVSQVALAATLVFSLSYMFTGGHSVASTANVTNATEAKVNNAAPVVADASIVNTQVAEPIILASFKMATELSSLQLTGQPAEKISSN